MNQAFFSLVNNRWALRALDSVRGSEGRGVLLRDLEKTVPSYVLSRLVPFWAEDESGVVRLTCLVVDRGYFSVCGTFNVSRDLWSDKQ